ncbi:MAG: elongation factor Ts [Gammaproteobacteria bacterium]|jgi:elongation factor Ts|nr:elongation factor Ts [Gammaproteobacteria bacterium]MBT7603991.1 elongation factor Ts [Gammaproteobacteria bacterium]
MSNITAQMVKELRERTGAGMMECKKSLIECGGEIDAAVELMRKAGHAKADKKSSRIAAEGVIKFVIKDDKKLAAMLEINCETDFAAKDVNFLEFVNEISNMSLESYNGNLDEFNQAKNSSGKTIEEMRLDLVSKVGENVKIRRIQIIKNDGAHIGHYMHGTKIGVAITLEKENADLAKDICMHIAAMKPIALDSNDLSPDDLEKERDIFLAQAKESGKPEEIIQKMVDGKIKKYISGVTLVDQPFVKDNEITIQELLVKHNNSIKLFYRLEVGEGIEKKDENFADEVMAQINK